MFNRCEFNKIFNSKVDLYTKSISSRFMKSIYLHLILSFVFFQTFGQQNDSVSNENKSKQHVYRVKWYIDAPIIVGGLVSNYYGVRVLKGKKGIDEATVLTLTPEDVPKFDRGATRQNPAFAETAMHMSDISLTTTIILPSLLLFDKKIRQDALRIGVIYLTTISLMSNCYSWGVGRINRYRPYVYNPNESIERRTRNGSKNSFYGGHAAAAATCSFFAAKVFADYHKGSKLVPVLYGLAVIPPAITAYYRYKAGMHFPSDLIVGTIAGAAIGIVVPELHKPRKKNKNMSFDPVIGPYQGFAMTYKF